MEKFLSTPWVLTAHLLKSPAQPENAPFPIIHLSSVSLFIWPLILPNRHHFFIPHWSTSLMLPYQACLQFYFWASSKLCEFSSFSVTCVGHTREANRDSVIRGVYTIWVSFRHLQFCLSHYGSWRWPSYVPAVLAASPEKNKKKLKTKQGKYKQRKQGKELAESADKLRSGLLRGIRAHNIRF